jgi:hypothetical protein
MSPVMSFPDQPQRHWLRLLRCFRILRCNSFKHSFCVALLLASFVGVGQRAWAQTWISAISAATTGNAAKVTWSTAVPADSQVEYGTTAPYGTVPVLAVAKVAAHSVAITGLTGERLTTSGCARAMQTLCWWSGRIIPLRYRSRFRLRFRS